MKVAAGVAGNRSRSDVFIARGGVSVQLARHLQSGRVNGRTAHEVTIASEAREVPAQRVRFVIATNAVVEVIAEHRLVDAPTRVAPERVRWAHLPPAYLRLILARWTITLVITN